MSRDMPPVWRSRWKRRLSACRCSNASSETRRAMPCGDRVEQELAQFGEERGRQAQRAVGRAAAPTGTTSTLRGSPGLSVERVDQVLQQQRHADVGELGGDQAGQRHRHPPAPLPDVGQQLGAASLQSERRWCAPAGRVAAGQAKAGVAHRAWPGKSGAGMEESAQVEPRDDARCARDFSADAGAVVPRRRCSLPDDRQLVMRVMPMPADTNGNGDIFGGWIMAQVDIAGARAAGAHRARAGSRPSPSTSSSSSSRSRWATCSASTPSVERIGRTSVTVNVEVFAERNPADLHVVKVTEANLTYVAIDDDGQPRRSPPGLSARPQSTKKSGMNSFVPGRDAVAVEVGDAVLRRAARRR